MLIPTCAATLRYDISVKMIAANAKYTSEQSFHWKLPIFSPFTKFSGQIH